MKNRIRNISIVVSVVLILAAVFFTIKTSRTIEETDYLKNMLTNPFSNTFNQVIFLTVLCLYGFMLGYCFKDILKMGYIIVLAPVFALTAWAMTGQLIITVGLVYNVYTAVGAMVLALLIPIIIKKPNFKDLLNADIFAVLLAYFALSFIFTATDYMWFTDDSYIYLTLGQSLVINGSMVPDIAHIYSARSLITPLMFTPSDLFGFDYENGLFTLFGFAFNVAVAYFVYDELVNKVSRRQAYIVAAISFLALMFSNFYSLVSMYYPMSNSFTNVFMFLAIFFAYKAKEKDENLLYISMIFMIAFIWTRTESVIVALIFMFFMTNMGFKNKNMIAYEVGCFAALASWYARFFMLAGIHFDEGKFLTITRALEISAVFIMFIIYTFLSKKFKFYEKIKSKLDLLPFAGMVLVLGAYIFINFSKFSINIGMVFVNLSLMGSWGHSMLIMMGLLAVYYFYVNLDKYDIWDKTLFAYIIAIFFIFLFRGPNLRLGYGDSGNRMFTAIVPMIVFIAASRLPVAIQSIKE